MKKLLALLLSLTIVITVLQAFGSLALFAETASVAGYEYEGTSSSSVYVKASGNDGVSDGVMSVVIKNLGVHTLKVTVSPRHAAGWTNLFPDSPLTIAAGVTAELRIPSTTAGDFFLAYFYSADTTDATVSYACSVALNAGSDGKTVKGSAVQLTPDFIYRFNTSGAATTMLPGIDSDPSGDYMIMTGRNHRCSFPTQDLISQVRSYGTGSYYISAQVRLTEETYYGTTLIPVRCTLGLDQEKAWPQTGAAILSTEWTQISGIVTLDASLSRAKIFIESLFTKNPANGQNWGSESSDQRAAKVDINADSICVVPLSDPDVNLVSNYDFENGVISWGVNQGGTLASSNTEKVAAYQYTAPSNISYWLKANGAEVKQVGAGSYLMTVYLKNLGTKKLTVKVSPRHAADWGYLFTDKTIYIEPDETAKLEIPVSSGDFFLAYFSSETENVKFACSALFNGGANFSTATRDADMTMVKADGTYVFAADGTYTYVDASVTPTPVPTLSEEPDGVYGIITNRATRSSCPSQTFTSALQTYGSGQYYLSAQIRLTKKAPAPVMCTIGIDQASAWPQTDAVELGTEWTHVSGIVTLDGSKRAIWFLHTLYRYKPNTDGEPWGNETQDQRAALDDLEIDTVLVVPMTSQTANLIVNPGFNVDDVYTIPSWGQNGACTLTSNLAPTFDTAPDDVYAIVKDRAHRCACPSETFTTALQYYGSGKYFISAQIRLTEAAPAPVTCSIGVDQANAWPATNAVTLTTEWQKISGYITLDASKRALFFLQSLYTINPETQKAWASGTGADTKAAKVDLEIDTVLVVPMSAPDVNLIVNPGFDVDEDFQIPSWGKNQVCTVISNLAPTFEPGEGVKQADDTIVYADGCLPYTDDNIVYSGRWFEKDGGMKGSFEGYAELTFTGTQIWVVGSGDTYISIDGGDEVHVQLGGMYRAGKNLTAGTHTVRVLAHAQQAYPKIEGFIIDEGAATVPAEETPVIEFIGDSITEGYVTNNNSYLNSYAYHTGNILGWKFNTIAFGGIAVTEGNGNPDAGGMAARYLRQTERGGFGENDDYDFTNDHVDYTVINLGTNDGKPTSETAINGFKKGYKDLLDNVFANHPDCTVFVMIPFTGRCKTLIEEVVAAYDPTKTIIIVYSDEWPMTYVTDPGAIHPDPDCHEAAAVKLAKIILDYHNNNTFYGANVVLGDTLTVNFYATLSDATDATVKITRNERTVTLTGTLDENTGKYVFAYTGVNPQCMTDNIHAELYVGGEKCQELDMSVKSYCQDLYVSKDATAELKALLDATLAYGGAAQQYASYRTDDLATPIDLTQFTAAKPAGVASTVVTPKTDDNNEVLSAGLRLENVPKIYFKLKAQDGVKAYLNGVEAEIVQDGELGYVYTDGLFSTQFAKEFTLTLKQGDTVLQAVRYSVNTYLQNKWDSTIPSLRYLVRALNEYGVTSEAYVASLEG